MTFTKKVETLDSRSFACHAVRFSASEVLCAIGLLEGGAVLDSFASWCAEQAKQEATLGDLCGHAA
jgi:hypothetical protein